MLVQVVGLLVTVLVVGYLSLTQTSTENGDRTGSSPRSGQTAGAARDTASLPAFQQRQLAINTTLFTGSLATFAQSWLPWVSQCSGNTQPGGPALRDGEKERIVCWFGNIAAYFVAYTSVADRDLDRTRVINETLTTATLAPGAVNPQERSGTAGNNSGMYVEYAYALTSGVHKGRTISGVWWDDADQPVAGYLLAYWQEGLGQSWDPLRDVWTRNS